MTEPIDKILKGLSNVKQRKWDTLEITSKNEFGKVMRDFNNMVQTLREKSKLSSFVAEQILELLSNEKGELIYGSDECACINSATGYNLNRDPSNKIKGGLAFENNFQNVLQEQEMFHSHTYNF